MFNLAYGLHWSYDDMREMPMEDLARFHQLLQDQWEREREDAKKARGSKR